jgi:hypothetical protein
MDALLTYGNKNCVLFRKRKIKVWVSFGPYVTQSRHQTSLNGPIKLKRSQMVANFNREMRARYGQSYNEYFSGINERRKGSPSHSLAIT